MSSSARNRSTKKPSADSAADSTASPATDDSKPAEVLDPDAPLESALDAPDAKTDVLTEATDVPADALTTPANDNGSSYVPEPPPGSDVTAVSLTEPTASVEADLESAAAAADGEIGEDAPDEDKSDEDTAAPKTTGPGHEYTDAPATPDADTEDGTLADAVPLTPPADDEQPDAAAATAESPTAPLTPPATPAPPKPEDTPRMPQFSDLGVSRAANAPYIYDADTREVPEPDGAFVRLNDVSAVWICQYRLIERLPSNNGNADIERLLLPKGAEVEQWQADQVTRRLRELKAEADADTDGSPE